MKRVRWRKNRKPRAMNGNLNVYAGNVYAGFAEVGSRFTVYVGGRCYNDATQIHLTAPEVQRLAKWLTKAAQYLKEKK